MGNTISSFYLLILSLYADCSEKTKGFLWGELKQKSYFNNDILLKDDEQKAGNFTRKLNLNNINRYSFFRRN